MTTHDGLVTAASAHGDEPRLFDEPRPFGRMRGFWQSHPRTTDILITIFAVLLGPPLMGVFLTQYPDDIPRPWLIAAAIVSTVVGFSLYWRRRAPILVFAICSVGVVAAVLGGMSISLIAAMVAMYSIAVYRRPRTAWICLGAVSVIVALALVASRATLDNPAVLIPSFGGITVALLLALLLGSNIYGVRRYQNALIERARQLEVQSDQRAELARSAERARIAREMHDVVSHSLTVVVALAEGATATPDRDRASMATTAIASTARNALTEMRGMLGVLRSDDDGAPLAPTTPDRVEDIVEMARGAGFPVTLKTTGVASATGAPALAISRIVQESLTNAMRHADAANITVSLWHTTQDTVIAVENDYPRASTRPSGYGLRGLQERAEHVGGSLKAGLTGRGTWRVDAVIPHADPVGTGKIVAEGRQE